ncbi:MAG TPA: hypothetical protein DCZ59_03885 [Bacteroidetes bacterium]|nr:hypothetical protein [Bacteroidota bacterium]
MKMTLRFFVILWVAVIAALSASCDSTPSEPSTPVDTTSVRFSNVQTDSIVKWLYISLDSMKVVDTDASPWDIRLPYIYCCGRTKAIPIQLNSGTNGKGTVAGAVVTARFETVSGIPSGVTLRTDDTTRPVVPLAVLGGDSFFVYDIRTHTLRPSPDKTLLVRSLGGALFKFSVTSIYKDAEPNPTLDTPISFYHFRIAKLKN